MRSQKLHQIGISFGSFFIIGVLVSVFASRPAQAQNYKFKVLHTFQGTDGAGPIGQLVRDATGNLYGVAAIGGTGRCQSNGQRIGCGTAFKMNKSGRILWQHSFDGQNGNEPQAGLLRDIAGNLFGTTSDGGKVNNHLCPDLYGCGVVFQLDDAGKETILHKFTGTPDGYIPESLLVKDSAGNLYGTAYIGGVNGYGTVFMIDETGKEMTLHNFKGGDDGCFPYPGVIRDTQGNLYGAAFNGGVSGSCNNGVGLIFKVDAAGNKTTIYSFSGADGAYPDSVLILDQHGNLFGTTSGGGSSNACIGGCGTVFELSPQQGGNWSEKVLYSFCSLPNCADGEFPGSGPLARDPSGNLYGVTESGGTYKNCNGTCGVIFKLSTSGEETVLHSFTGGTDGAAPLGGLTTDAQGNLYGSALQGGNLNCMLGNGIGCGIAFKVRP
jgi:uncharacterized repeat protein (TIGR03803 family)